MIYIASPYSSPIKSEREDRAYQVGAFAAHCVKRGHVVYCPIAAWHHLAVEHKLPGDACFWERLNRRILRHCFEMWVLKLDGYDDSEGVNAEIIFAKALGITLRYFDGDNFAEVI